MGWQHGLAAPTGAQGSQCGFDTPWHRMRCCVILGERLNISTPSVSLPVKFDSNSPLTGIRGMKQNSAHERSGGMVKHYRCTRVVMSGPVPTWKMVLWDEKPPNLSRLGYAESVLLWKTNWNPKSFFDESKQRVQLCDAGHTGDNNSCHGEKCVFMRQHGSRRLRISLPNFFYNHFEELSTCQYVHVPNCINFSFQT